MKNHLKSIISLTVICAVVAALLAFSDSLTFPVIAENEKKAAAAAMRVVLPGGENFESVDISGLTLPETVKEAYSEENGGYVFKLEASGYSSGMMILCAVDADGKIAGATCLSSGETLGYEKTYGDSLKGSDAGSINGVDTVAGATKTTRAYKNAVKDALKSAQILKDTLKGDAE